MMRRVARFTHERGASKGQLISDTATPVVLFPYLLHTRRTCHGLFDWISTGDCQRL